MWELYGTFGLSEVQWYLASTDLVDLQEHRLSMCYLQVSEPSLPEINIAVIGAEGVGKSTFVQNALDLPYPAPSAAAERKIPIDGSVYLVRLLELPIDDVDIDDDDTVSWPDTIENKMMPKVDGALTLYNVKDKGSFEDIPDMLSECSNHVARSKMLSPYIRSLSMR